MTSGEVLHVPEAGNSTTNHKINFSFRTKLNYNPPKDDGSTYKIELEGISVDIMKEILDYIFSGQVWY